MKRLSILLAILGLAVSTVLVAWFGVGRVAGAVFSVGIGGFALILAWQAVLFITLGLAWGRLLPGVARWLPIWGRMVRDAAGNCLPFSQLGGYVMGGRAITLYGVPWPRAAASTVVDVTAEFLAQLIFGVFGVAMLAWHHPGSALIWPATIGIGLALLAAIAFVALQNGVGPILRLIAGRLAGDNAPAGQLEAELAGIYARKRRLLGAVILHLLGWTCSGVGSWIAYRLLGAAISLPDALTIEALLTAALSLAFAIPGAVGVQEAAFTGLGTIYGLSPDISLGVSILRRARDLAVGVPILIAWQATEARGLRRTRNVR